MGCLNNILNNKLNEMGFKIYSFIFILVISSHVQAVSDNEWGVMAGATLNLDFQAYVHDGRNPTLSVIPTIFYDNSLFYIESDEAGFYLNKDEKNEFRLNAYYDSTEFDPNHDYWGINKRKWSVMAGASYMRITPYGGFKLQVGTDVLGRSKGTVVTASYLAELSQGAWTWYPEFGINWNNHSYNQYYYGVTNKEAEKVGIKPYDAKSGFQPYLSLNSSYKVNPKWDIISGVEFNYLTDELYRSPLVNKRFEIVGVVGFLYHF